jgi:DNA-binding GntR family transcriptional regulator
MPVWKWLCSQMLLADSRLDNYQQLYDEHADIFKALQSGKRQAVVDAIKANIR